LLRASLTDEQAEYSLSSYHPHNLTMAQQKLLDKRVAQFGMGETETLSWDDAKTQLMNK